MGTPVPRVHDAGPLCLTRAADGAAHGEALVVYKLDDERGRRESEDDPEYDPCTRSDGLPRFALNSITSGIAPASGADDDERETNHHRQDPESDRHWATFAIFSTHARDSGV